MWPAARNTAVSSPQSVTRSPQSVARSPQPECGPQPAARNAIYGPQPAARNLATLV